MYSTATYNLTFRKGYNFNAKRFCCSPKQRTFKRDAYTATYDLDNRLQTFGNKTITYDNDGNMTSGPAATTPRLNSTLADSLWVRAMSPMPTIWKIREQS